jgi:hypothetical protein
MLRLFLATVIVLLSMLGPTRACSICSGDLAQKSTLRQTLATAKAALRGDLKNPQLSNDFQSGTTELHITSVLKNHAIIEKQKLVLIPRYLPVIGNTPTDYIVFVDEVQGKPDIITGYPGSAELAQYLTSIAKLDAKTPTTRLAFYFAHLDSTDATVAQDAFLEFVKATDTELTEAKAVFDTKKLRHWLADPKLPAEKIGVYALLLGSRGDPADQKLFPTLATQALTREGSGALAGVLAGWTLLDTRAGFTAIHKVLLDPKRDYAERLNALSAVRYLYANHAKSYAQELGSVYHSLLSSDLADLAIGDLRRYRAWNFTDAVLGTFGKPGQSALVQRLVVRFALTSPEASAKKFLDELRQTNPKMVREAEEFLRETEGQS